MQIDNSQSSNWVYKSSQTHMTMKNGKVTKTTEAIQANTKGGTKTVRKNGKTKTLKLTKKEIQNIKDRKFMPEFFTPCYQRLQLDRVGGSGMIRSIKNTPCYQRLQLDRVGGSGMIRSIKNTPSYSCLENKKTTRRVKK